MYMATIRFRAGARTQGDAAQLVAVAVWKVKGAGDQVLDCEGAGWTLHQLRHSLLTHEAESGTSTD